MINPEGSGNVSNLEYTVSRFFALLIKNADIVDNRVVEDIDVIMEFNREGGEE